MNLVLSGNDLSIRMLLMAKVDLLLVMVVVDVIIKVVGLGMVVTVVIMMTMVVMMVGVFGLYDVTFCLLSRGS